MAASQAPEQSLFPIRHKIHKKAPPPLPIYGMIRKEGFFAIADDRIVIVAIRKIMPTKIEERTAPAFIVAFSQIPTNVGGISFEVQDYSAAVEKRPPALRKAGVV